MDVPNHNVINRYIKYAIIVLIALLVILGVFFVREYRALHRAQLINSRALFLSSFVEHHGALTASDADFVRSWMTFDYVNRLFALPSSYLQGSLTITDPHYPRLSISSYAKEDHITPSMAVSEVESAIRDHVTNATTSAT